MAAFDRYHQVVVRALLNAGWIVIGEQVLIALENRHLWIDIEVRHPQTQQKALIEVKTFEPSGSVVEYLSCAVGQYDVYRLLLSYLDIQTPLYMAVPISARYGIFEEEIGRIVADGRSIRLFVFDPHSEEIVEWAT
jgi:hypothetical protein